MRRHVRCARAAVLTAMVVVPTVVGTPARAATDCPRRAVVVTVPGITWWDVRRFAPPTLLALLEDAATGSLSVRTVQSRTTLASGFATIGAGNRVEAGRTTGGVAGRPSASVIVPGFSRMRAGGVAEMKALAEEADYGAVPGAFGAALGDVLGIAIGNGDIGRPPPLPAGFGRWALLAVMDQLGEVDAVAVGDGLLRGAADDPRTDDDALLRAVDVALEQACAVTIVDHGDLSRLDRKERIARMPLLGERAAALEDSAELLNHVARRLDPENDLLVVVSPTSPAWDDDTHFGIAAAIGPNFAPGSELESASTRRPGIVTLVDVAPTLLEHFGLPRPAAMAGRPFVSVAPHDPDRIDSAIELDAESVFIDRMRTPVVTGYVIFQVVVYLLTIWLLSRRERSAAPPASGLLRRAPEVVALALVAFPVTTYLAGAVPQHALLGTGGSILSPTLPQIAAFVGLLVSIDTLLVVVAWFAAKASLQRLLLLTAFTMAIMVVDLMTGSRLQLNTVFSYSPLVAGRFAGLGNIGFSVLTAATVISGTLIAHRANGSKRALAVVAVLFAVAVVVDGAPAFGSDVGGIIALVPGFAITWMLLAGRRPDTKILVLSGLAAVAALALFLAIDLTRPEESRSHLARLYEGVREGGGQVFVDAISRKVRTNLRVFRSTIWTYLVPLLLGAMAWLLLRPRGRWQRLASIYPRLHAGLVGALVLSVLGFFVNDSGIVIPAVILSFLVPMAVVIHLTPELSG